MKSAAVIFSALALGGCAAMDPTPGANPNLEVVTPIKLTAPQIAALQDGVRAALKDPTSAQFGDYVAGTKSTGQIAACGWVNARNSYGGYTGRRPYLAITLPSTVRFQAQGIGGTETETSAVLTVCGQMGLGLAS